MLELASLAEVECRARQALLQDRHDRDEHLRADLRVELEVLLDVELGHLAEGLLHEVFDFALFQLALLSIDIRSMASALSIVHALAVHCTIERALALLLPWRLHWLDRGSAGLVMRLERDVAQKDVDLIWRDHAVAVEVIPVEIISKFRRPFVYFLKFQPKRHYFEKFEIVRLTFEK